MINGDILPTKLLLKEVEKPTTTKSGIILSTISREPQITGTVIKLGSAVKEISIGQRVIYYPNAALRFELPDGETAMLLENRDVLYYYQPE